jgi:hypothetical protein
MYLCEKIRNMDVKGLIPGQHIYNFGRDSSVGMATVHGLDGPEI